MSLLNKPLIAWSLLDYLEVLVVVLLGYFACMFLYGLYDGVRAARWRPTAKVGDRCRFYNAGGTWTRATITKVNGTYASIESQGYGGKATQAVPLSALYPE